MHSSYRIRDLLLRLMVAVVLSFGIPELASAQDDYLPPDNEDIDEVAQMLDRVEYYSTECGRYTCPLLDCFTARKAYEDLFHLRRNSRFLAFWLSKIPQFEESDQAKARYQKVAAIFRRLDSLLGGSTSSKNMSNCLLKLRPACGDLTAEPKLSDRYGDFIMPYARVTFPEGEEPSKGTAENPDLWKAGIEVYTDAVKRSRIFLAAFPFPQLEESWIELDRRAFKTKEESEVRYYISRCCTTQLRFVITRPGARPLDQGEKGDNSGIRKKEITRFDSITVRMPARSGEYELRLYDPETRSVIAFAAFTVR